MMKQVQAKIRSGLTLRFLVLGIVGVVLFLGYPSAQAQQLGGANFRPTGIRGSVGVGVAEFDIGSPKGEVKLDQGLYAAITGERGFESLPVAVTLSINFMRSTGRANYSYRTLAANVCAQDNVGFSTQEFQMGLGFKWKILGSAAWFSPYAEAGGLFGYNQLKYQLGTVACSPSTDNYRDNDALTTTGYYGDGGLEIQFSASFGVRAGFRYSNVRSRPFETLDNQSLRYDMRVFQIGVLKSF